jgi:diguanylate cyclase (GGDEF)-like protein
VFHIVDEQSRLPARDPIQRCLQEGRIVGLANHTVLISRDGQEHDIDDSAAPIHSRDGQLLGAVLVFHDVTETRRIARQMAFDASHDLLTGLINRREFENRLERALLSAKEFGEQHVLCYLDLDQFKIINDTAGHAVGDQMLKEVTQLLSGLFRRNDTLSRLGGDEFGLLLMNCPMEKAAAIAANVIDQLNQYRFHWQGRHFQIGVSIGAVAINAGSESIAKVLSQADVACYTAKDLGRGRVHIFHPADAETIQRHSELVLAVRLREAIEREQFVLYCQPIIPLLNNTTDRQAHYELLLRMVDEEGRLVPPATFIGPAERYDLMGTIDRWVIQAAFRLYSRRFNGDGPNFAINLSGNSLNDDSLLDYVLAKMQEFKIPPEKLCFEITETAAIHNLNKAQHFAHEIRRQGVRIALDDFGSGLSSFRYLKVLPVDYLKIDGSFVREMLDSVTDMAMVSAINQVGHSLGIQTIAEHVTSLQIADCVRNLGVDYAQGFGLGHPMPVEEAWKFDG